MMETLPELINWLDDSEVYRECRVCGATVERTAEECSACGSGRIAEYELP